MVIGPQSDQRGDDPASVIGQLFGHPQGPVTVTQGQPEASFQLVSLGEEHGVVASQRGPCRRQ